MHEGQKRGEKLGLTDDEVAFYDALETNHSAVKVLGGPTLKAVARELVVHVRKSVTIDWTLRESPISISLTADFCFLPSAFCLCSGPPQNTAASRLEFRLQAA